jgi:hypothetical protein
MSKGGAGKVYFVLYLAVILELLIIIVERDEAEEHLMAKQKESMRIVESILSQLQVGAGSEGINTRPQDQITIPPPGINVKEAIGADLKPERRYLIEVGVTDVNASLKQLESEEPEAYLDRLHRYIRLANVSDLTYEVFHSKAGSNEEVPLDSNAWSKKGETVLKLNIDEMEKQLDNIYNQHKGDQATLIDNLRSFMTNALYEPAAPTGFKPGKVSDPEFFYDREETIAVKERAAKKRVFVVNFEPKEEGWYKLRFTSKANKILGVYNRDNNMEIDPDQKVNIGTVTLKVKDLLKVRDALEKNVSGLPPSELAKTDMAAFMDQLNKLKESATELEVRSKTELYGYIVKLVTPGLSEGFDQNKSAIEYNIRVLKPQPQITDPAIADLRTVVRVFDGLQTLTLPMRITPSNGQTVILQNPGSATISGGAGAASASGGGGKWVDKELVIPVKGSLSPRDEPYVFELVQKNGPKTSEVAKCSVYVYPSKITNATDVLSALEASWGDPLELVVSPASGNTIKPDEFIMQFSFGGGSQVAPLRKLSVAPSDGIVVPPGSSEVALTVAWKDPLSGDVVQLFDGKGEVGLKKPLISLSETAAEPINDQMGAEFKVVKILVRAPMISAEERAEVGDVKVNITNSSVRDMKTGQTYTVVAVGKPRRSGAGNDYEVTLKLQGGKFPLTKGQVKGKFTIAVSATARSQGAESRPRTMSRDLTVSN